MFLAVVAHGSLNAAARALRLSQPTMARRMRALEDVLGVPLMQREPNRMTLTEAGRAVLEAASPMAEAAAAVPRSAAAYRPDPQAPVRITATASVTMFLSLHSAALAQTAAPAEVAFLPTRRRLDLAAGEADIALRMRRLPDAVDLVGRRVGRIAFTMYAHRDHASDTVIAPPRGSRPLAPSGFRRPLRGGTHRRGPDRRHADPLPGDAGEARRGVPAVLAGDSDPDLRRVAEPVDELTEDVFLVMHTRSRRRREVTRVTEALVTCSGARRKRWPD